VRKLLERAGVGTGRVSGFQVALCAALLLLGVSRADASTLTLGAQFGNDQFNNAFGSAASVTEGPDANNFAEAKGDPSTGKIGVGVMNDGSAANVNETLNAVAILDEQWQAICGLECPQNIPAGVTIQLHGVLSADWSDATNTDSGSIFDEVDLGADRFQFTIFQGGGAFVTSRVCLGGHSCVTYAPVSAGTPNPDGSITLDFTQTFGDVLPENFDGLHRLSVGWEAGVTHATSAKLLDTATYTITATDPGVSFSSDGRTVPEPAALGLLALGLMSVGVARPGSRRRSRPGSGIH